MKNIISLRVNEQELSILKQAASVYGGGISSMIKKLAFEKLEDDYDLKVISEYEKEKEEGTLETYTHEETWKMLGL